MTGIHGVASDMHTDHVFRMWAPGERSEEHVFDFGLGEANVFMGGNTVAKCVDVHEWNGDGIASAG